MKTIFFALLICFAGCNDDGTGDTTDLRIGTDDGGAPCKDTSQCPSNQYVCAYKIADGCSAVGHCVPVRTPTCASIIELCGCDGKMVQSGPCFYQDGYAGGATTGATRCGDGGI